MTEDQKVPDFNLVDGHGYMLDRNYAAASRLNYQYYLWKESLHFNIHPSIPIPADNAQIADVATGTAIWLVDAARDLPTAQLDGFDINLGQAPLQQWLPPNVRLREWNVFDDVPLDLLGRYDIVHVRLLILVVEHSDPRPIIRQLIKMLKPGGYLQWDDLNYPDTCVKAIDPSLPTPALHEFRKLAYSRGRHDWTLQLAELMRDEGLEEAKLYHFEDRIELAKANGEQHLLTMEEFASRLATVGNRDEAAKLYQLIKDVYKESMEGAALSMPRVVCVARKARSLNNSPAAMSRIDCPWYKAAIGPRLKPVTKRVYQVWSGLTGDELESHLHRIRDQAWPLGEYPCIGEWIFLLPSISAFPEYPGILDRAKAGATILDLGCCFGQNLRLLAADGVSTHNMYATDISAELWDLGYVLFRDKDKMRATFIQADIFNRTSDLQRLNGQMDIIIACQFLHLFDWDRQVIAAKRIVECSRPGSVLVGYQRAQVQAQELLRPWGAMYFHNVESFKKMWSQVEAETGTKWKLSISLVDLQEWGMEEEDVEWMPPGRKGINFVITRDYPYT